MRPFKKEPTDVTVEQMGYNEQTGYNEQIGEFTLKVKPVRGDSVYFDIGAEPTTASGRVEQHLFNPRQLLLLAMIAKQVNIKATQPNVKKLWGYYA